MARDYKKEAKWESSPEQVARRVQRNRARRKAIKTYGKKALRGKEVGHIGKNRKGKLSSRTKIISKKSNRKDQPKRDGSQD